VAAAAAVVGCLICLVLLPAAVATAVSDVAQGVAAAAGAAGAAWHARGAADRVRTAWTLIAAACGAWTAGEAYWCWHTLRGDEAPFPSVADAGFLGFAVLMAVALLVHPAPGGRGAVTQRLLDGLMTAGAVGLISWLTTVGAVAHAAAGDATLQRLLLFAYPISDVLLVLLTVLLLARAGRRDPALWLVGAGVLALGVSDSAFAALAATDVYDTGLLELGWIGGFLLVGLAGTCGEPSTAPPAAAADPLGDAAAALPPAAASVLPYMPVLGALTVVGVTVLGRSLTLAEVLAACLVVLCLLARQYVAVVENARLARALSAQQQLLRRQALSDSLTGLPNRALFRDRLEHALALHARHGRSVVVAFLDLDGFKGVNDTLGHAIGDDLLVEVARRLSGAVRDGDTVARLGGDEFAVLLEDTGAPLATTERIRVALAAPFTLAGAPRIVRTSLGVAEVGAGHGPATADDLLARADAAMYAAKRAGKAGRPPAGDLLPSTTPVASDASEPARMIGTAVSG
jgi:diguanylate cyclase (GGDEF)-like protein